MIVEIKEDIFKGNDFSGLNYLIQILTYRERYELFLDLSTIKTTSNYERLDIDVKNDIEHHFNKIILEELEIEPKHFISKNINDNSFNIEESIRYFIQPVSIILENSLNDQYFLKALIRCFDKNSKVKRHLENGWIQFENAGGCGNVENFIEGKLQSFNNLSCLCNKKNYFYLRCFVLLDSDKEYPNAPIEKYTKLFKFLNENNITSHVLEKRCMENYMPEQVFDDMATTDELKQWTNAYLHLSNEQKDFLNISSGFSKKKEDGTPKEARSNLKQEIQNLYSNISQSNYEKLDNGFKLPKFKTEFPKRFLEHHQVHKNNLQDRCGTKELQNILDKIAELL